MTTAMKQHVFQNKKLILGCIFFVVVWLVVFWQGISTAIEIWLESDIFNHCLLVIPGSFYLIYCKRYNLNPALLKPNYWLLPIIIGCLFVYAVGIAGDVQLFMHLSAFVFLPLVTWMFIGNKLAYQIMFPLFFILFSIPFGEEFIPFLQEITADWSVALLNLTGIPIFRNGLYIEIPQGRFLVAEACSGISFFIASVVIGSLYTHLNIYSFRRKVFFVGISIIFPILANAIRVYGIILTGYLTDMEHAVGADHLIYGWIFFSLVIVCLLAIGELVREKNATKTESIETETGFTVYSSNTMWRTAIIILGLLSAFYVWFNIIQGQLKLAPNPQLISINSVLLSKEVDEKQFLDWSPKFKKPFSEYQGQIRDKDTNIDIFIAWYPKGSGELITSLNRLYHEKSWTLGEQQPFDILDNGKLNISTIVNPDKKRLLTYWYVVDEVIFFDKRIAKLVETWNILMGQHKGSGLVAMSKRTEQIHYEADKEAFKGQVMKYFEPLSKSFKFE